MNPQLQQWQERLGPAAFNQLLDAAKVFAMYNWDGKPTEDEVFDLALAILEAGKCT